MSAAAVVVLLVVFFVMRVMASACTGGGCDAYIPLSLFIPVLVLGATAVTGIVATSSARGSEWFVWLLMSTVLGVAGPPVALLIFKNGPDAFVVTATILCLQVAVVALAYSFYGRRPQR